MSIKKENIRYIAAKIIIKIINGSSLRETNFEKETNHNKNISLIKAICYGVLRHYYELIDISKEFLSKKLKNKDQEILILLLIGFYELIYLNSKPFAVINETVEASKLFKKDWAKNLLNACLRNFTRSNLDLEKFKQHPNHPDWLINEIKNSWPNKYQEILIANNQKAPLTIRINTKNISIENYKELLKKSNIEYNLISGLQHALIIVNPISFENIPGFDKGYFYIQDAASQLAVKLLNINVNDKNILDACAAPGGKTSYIMQILNELDNKNCSVLAIDNNEKRAAKILDNLKSLKLLDNNIHVHNIDAGEIDIIAKKNEKFNKILLDAPCSATGVIRRHPDIKHHRLQSDISSLNEIQLNLLKKLWEKLEDNGEIIYCTCSILDSENEDIISAFSNYLIENNKKYKTINLEDHASKLGVNHKGLVKRKYGLSSIPEDSGLFDGFYYCKIIKLI